MGAIRPIDYKKLSKVFESDGWVFSHQKGDHLIYKKSGAIRPVVIPTYKEIPTFIILNNLKVAGMTRLKYFQLLSKK